jgi:ABC-2 type transport system permease protein
MPYLVDLAVLAVFCTGLFAVSLYNIQRRWIA